jgi:myb proto-oncogene protein
MLGTKTGKQIRERYINKLDPKIKKEEWTEEEDLLLIQLYS